MAQKKSASRKPVAKKKPSPRKKSPAKKSNKSSNTGALVFLVILLVVIAVATFYTIRDVASPAQQTAQEAKPTSTPKTEAPKREEPSKFEEVKSQELDEPVETIERNSTLPENDDPNAYYYTSSFDFAWPAYEASDQIVEHTAYALSYDEKREQPHWVAYKLTDDRLSGDKVKRTDNFKEDPMVRSGSASLADYKGTGYDRGHLAPAADFAWSLETMKESFYMSNMSPQTPGFNRGIWKKLEEQVRDWAIEHDELYIVVGPLYRGKVATVGDNKVAIPTSYYKAILDISPPKIKAIGFIMPNAKSNEELEDYVVTLDDIERQSGLNLFPIIPDDLEERLESQSDFSAWD